MKICNLGGRVVNNYLLRMEGGSVLIDTGYPGGFAAFRRKLAREGARPEEIRYIFLTHAHDDHAGFLNEVLAATDAKVILHPVAVKRLTWGQNSFEGGCSTRLAWVFCRLMALFGKAEHRYPPLEARYADRLIPLDSDAFRALEGGLPFAVLRTPGHKPDSISLMAEGMLFCGDAAMNDFPSVRRNIIWIENLKDYRASWDVLLRARPTMLYPAHGRPFPPSDLERFRPRLKDLRLWPLRPRGAEERA